MSPSFFPYTEDLRIDEREKKSYPVGKRHHFISSLLLGGNVDMSE